MNTWDEMTGRLQHQPVVVVSVESTQGSVPREAGTWMAVLPDALLGTIGGGHLELQAIQEARLRLAALPAQAAAHANQPVLRYALGPSLGQCCGGVVYLRFDVLPASSQPTLPAHLQLLMHRPAQALALFGGGHVGKALIHVLGPLPFSVRWIDSRDEIFPAQVPANVLCEHSDPVQAAVAELGPGSQVLIMSFSHAEDLDVVAACLKRQRERADLAFIGLIGSKTKWATFQHRLEERGFSVQELAQITCPIGLPGVAGKEPEVIAVAVAAQLLHDHRRTR